FSKKTRFRFVWLRARRYTACFFPSRQTSAPVKVWREVKKHGGEEDGPRGASLGSTLRRARRGQVGQQGGAPPPQRRQVGFLVVGRPLLPAAVDDADPLEGQRPHRRVVAAPASPLLARLGARPRGARD